MAGVSAFLKEFEDPADTPAPKKIETIEQRRERKVQYLNIQSFHSQQKDILIGDRNFHFSIALLTDPCFAVLVLGVS